MHTKHVLTIFYPNIIHPLKVHHLFFKSSPCLVLAINLGLVDLVVLHLEAFKTTKLRGSEAAIQYHFEKIAPHKLLAYDQLLEIKRVSLYFSHPSFVFSILLKIEAMPSDRK